MGLTYSKLDFSCRMTNPRECEVGAAQGMYILHFIVMYITRPQAKLFPFDHVNPSPRRAIVPPKRYAILYASLEDPTFMLFHQLLYEMSSDPTSNVGYVLRHVPPIEDRGEKLDLSGYGVTLDLKKTDYLAMDDRRSGGSAGVGTPQCLELKWTSAHLS